MLSQTTYISTATIDDLTLEVDQIIETAKRNNAKAGVTGVLLYAQGTFLQVLEGEPYAVETIYDRIAADHRHGNVTILSKGEISERRFKDWNMGWSQVPEDHPAAARIAHLGRKEAYEDTEDSTEVDSLIEAFFELNQT